MTKEPNLSRPRKAAMMVQYLLRDGQDLPLSKLSEETQLRLTRELGALHVVDRDTLDSVAREFAEELGNVALPVPGSVEGALAALDGKISPTAAARLRAETANTQGADPWAQLLALGQDKIAHILQTESTEVGAILLSKLPTGKAAEILGVIPGELARRVAYAVSRTAAVLPDAVDRIGRALSQQYCGGTAPAFVQPPSQRVGAILNSSGAQTRDQVLEGLGSEDPDFADSVRKAIFTFLDIPARLAAPDIPKILRDVPGGDLVTALAAAEAAGGPAAAVAEFLLGNMSQRMAGNLREEMAETGKIKSSEGEAAQAVIVTAIRAAADGGQITLIAPEDDE